MPRISTWIIVLLALGPTAAVRGETALELIYRAYDTPDDVRAIALFTEALGVSSNSVYAYAGRGIRRQESGDLTGAIADLGEAIRLNPLFADAYVWRAEARKASGDDAGYQSDMAAASKAKSQGDYALLELDRAVSGEPGKAAPYLDRARYKKHKGDFRGAIEDYDRYLAAVGRPNNHLALFERANAKKAVGDMDGAIGDYSTAIRMFPNNVDAYAKRSALRREIGDMAGSASDAQQMRDIQLVQKQERIEALTRAMESGGDQPRLLIQRSELWMNIGNYTNALDDAREALRHNPGSREAKRMEKRIQDALQTPSHRNDAEQK